jgi:hypothetical protein
MRAFELASQTANPEGRLLSLVHAKEKREGQLAI